MQADAAQATVFQVQAVQLAQALEHSLWEAPQTVARRIHNGHIEETKEGTHLDLVDLIVIECEYLQLPKALKCLLT